MQNEEFQELLIKYRAGRCTEAEKIMVERWYTQFNEHNTDVPQEIIEEWGIEIKNKLPRNDDDPKRLGLWPFAIAASVTLVVGLGLYNYNKIEPVTIASHATHDIAPGGNHAIFTLANGKTINLSTTKTGVIINAKKLTYNDSTTVINSGINPGLQSITTPKGGQYQVSLPDGSKVWLNAATTLKFPQSFVGSAKRMVQLSGEAYFEVAKDKLHPFIVKSKLQELQVLGTHFNISAYQEEPTTKSTLLEGSIKINGNVLLQPGDQATKTKNSIHVEQVDTDNAVAWKNGEFMFRKESLESIMRKIARWYNVEVVYVDQGQAKKLFGGEISRFTNVSEVLNMLQLTGQVHFKIEGRRIMVGK